MARAFIGLGANLGDRGRQLTLALARLGAFPSSAVTRSSAIREYPPVGGPPQGPYLNAVAELTTRLTPRDLLRRCQQIETELGRVREAESRWGPRLMDLDLLLYDDVILADPALTIPHPRLHERRFVLEPLAEIAPSAYHPVLQRTAWELLAQLHP